MSDTRIGVITPVYNNATFLRSSIESVIDFADSITIIEGAWNPELPSRSTDGTLEVIEGILRDFKSRNIRALYYEARSDLELPETNTYRPIVLANELRAKQIALDSWGNDYPDWFMLVDSDEVYHKNQLEWLKATLLEPLSDVEDEVFSIDIPAFVFYFNYFFGTYENFHRITSIREKPQIDYTDTLKNTKGLPVNRMILDRNDILMAHYGYVADERIPIKMSMWDEKETEYWYNEVYLPARKGNINVENCHLFARKLGYGGKFEEVPNFNHPGINRSYLIHPEFIKELDKAICEDSI